MDKLQKHESQTDYAKGFGGKYGVQDDRQDKASLSWDHHERPEKHQSQITDYKVTVHIRDVIYQSKINYLNTNL